MDFCWYDASDFLGRCSANSHDASRGGNVNK